MLTNIKNWLVLIVRKCFQVYFSFCIKTCQSPEILIWKCQVSITVAVIIQPYYSGFWENLFPLGGISPLPKMSGNDGNVKKTRMNLV